MPPGRRNGRLAQQADSGSSSQRDCVSIPSVPGISGRKLYSTAIVSEGGRRAQVKFPPGMYWDGIVLRLAFAPLALLVTENKMYI